MIVLYIYLGTIVFSFSTFYLADKALNKEIENRGYKKQSNKKKNIFKEIFMGIKSISFVSIPIINLVFDIILIAKIEEVIDEIISADLDKGNLIKIEEKEEDLVVDNVDDKVNSVIKYDVKNELTREEKINFLKQEYFRLTGEQLSNNKKSKKVKQKTKLIEKKNIE